MKEQGRALEAESGGRVGQVAGTLLCRPGLTHHGSVVAILRPIKMPSYVYALIQTYLTELVVRLPSHFVQNPSCGCRYLSNAVGCVQSGARRIESTGGRPVITAARVHTRHVSVYVGYVDKALHRQHERVDGNLHSDHFRVRSIFRRALDGFGYLKNGQVQSTTQDLAGLGKHLESGTRARHASKRPIE